MIKKTKLYVLHFTALKPHKKKLFYQLEDIIFIMFHHTSEKYTYSNISYINNKINL